MMNLRLGQEDAQVEEDEEEMDLEAQERAEPDKRSEVVRYEDRKEPAVSKKKPEEPVYEEPEEGMYINEFI